MYYSMFWECVIYGMYTYTRPIEAQQPLPTNAKVREHVGETRSLKGMICPKCWHKSKTLYY